MSNASKKKSIVVYPEDLCILKEDIQTKIQILQQQTLTASDHAVKQELHNQIARRHNLLTLINTDHPDEITPSNPSVT